MKRISTFRRSCLKWSTHERRPSNGREKPCGRIRTSRRYFYEQRSSVQSPQCAQCAQSNPLCKRIAIFRRCYTEYAKASRSPALATLLPADTRLARIPPLFDHAHSSKAAEWTARTRLFTSAVLAITNPQIPNAMHHRHGLPPQPHRSRPGHVAPSNSAFSALINILGNHALNPTGL